VEVGTQGMVLCFLSNHNSNKIMKLSLFSSIVSPLAWLIFGLIAFDHGASLRLSVGIGFIAFVLIASLTSPKKTTGR
jgi:hypothetical protein